MAATINTQRPNFHGLTGTQPVGHTQIAVAAEYAGTITAVTRINNEYWGISTRDVRGAFKNPALAVCAHIWMDPITGEYVVDYWELSCQSVEAGRTRTIGAAIGIACDTTARRWAQSQ